ncbi:MAG TPA: acyl-CoA desaturase [Gemmatimonadales bacterium]|nr:acyl-CoA desaturase [Gemmatimonadales bacterium]
MSKPVCITFPNRDYTGFAEEVKDRVAGYFSDRGLTRNATPAMVVKTVVLLTLTFLPYGLALTNRFSALTMLGFAVLMGIGLAGIGFAISHDALHGAYSKNPRVNELLGRTFDLLGANGYMWKITHNVIHHTYTNIDGIDEDLAVSPLLRLSPGAPLLRIHRFQHLYGLAAYSMSTIFWVFVKDFKYFFQKDLGPYKDKKHARSEWVNLWISKAVYYGWSIVIPLLVLNIPWWQFAIGYVVMHLTAGFILGVVFQLAHVVEGPEYPVPDATGKMEEAWLVHEMDTTANFARSSRLVSWYVGGLNYQIEHHLFPRTCSVHYPAISHIVKDVAVKYGVPYYEQPTVMSAVRSHLRMLRKFGPEAWAARRAEKLQVAVN